VINNKPFLKINNKQLRKKRKTAGLGTKGLGEALDSSYPTWGGKPARQSLSQSHTCAEGAGGGEGWGCLSPSLTYRPHHQFRPQPWSAAPGHEERRTVLPLRVLCSLLPAFISCPLHHLPSPISPNSYLQSPPNLWDLSAPCFCGLYSWPRLTHHLDGC